MRRKTICRLCTGLTAALLATCAGCVSCVRLDSSVVENHSVNRCMFYWTANLPGTVEDVRDATLKALSALGIQTVLANKADELSGIVDGRFADEQEFEIHMRRDSPSNTVIAVRCGFFGSKERSLRLLGKIIEKLSPAP